MEVQNLYQKESFKYLCSTLMQFSMLQHDKITVRDCCIKYDNVTFIEVKCSGEKEACTNRELMWCYSIKGEGYLTSGI